jgi:hypothetical protein
MDAIYLSIRTRDDSRFIALSRVSCRGVFSQLKRCRVRNTTCRKAAEGTSVGGVLLRPDGGGSCDNQRRGGARLYTSALPGNGRLVDADTAGYVLVHPCNGPLWSMTVTPIVS